MTNNLVKIVCVLAFSTSPAVAKSSHHHDGRQQHSYHHQRVKHRLPQADVPLDSVTCLANTAYREARNSETNLQAVANVVKNRLRAGWGRDYCHVIRTGRFVYRVSHVDRDDYAKAYEVAQKVIQDELPDNTGGAVFFHASRLRHLPGWAKPELRTASIDGNVFYRDELEIQEN
ncbi:cell wall hydrolase [Methylococcus sp. EFPC2]|uniref:cell wall hydrolase n=1 Tax=Methylococcus sp. EFPC2 TaxID=2812648 RepID=UPI0019672726|nr:cell wall hydrolase [Methylococcus sp. EFPC2]QSA96904.1 cell wall hydrolase [Methylococcus sp. EFPC2]